MNRKARIINKENNRLDKQIKEENQEVFTDMICYLRGADISDYEIECVRRDLTEMVLSAQSRGENIDTVIGEDYKEFCDSVIANLPPKTKKQKLIEMLDLICWILSILFTINVLISRDTIFMIENLIKGTPADFYISISIGTFVSMMLIVLIASLLVTWIMKNAFREEKKQEKILFIMGGALLGAVLVIIGVIGRSTLFNIHILLACVLAAVLFGAHKVLENV